MLRPGIFKLFSLFFTSLLAVSTVRGQIFPVEGSVLNYRIAGFSWKQIPNRDKSELFIADGHFSSMDSFRQHVIKTAAYAGNRAVAELPYWGRAYTWTWECAGHTDSLHHFS